MSGLDRNVTDNDSKLAARFGSAHRTARSRKLTVDNSLRRVTLPEGGWRLFGCATQIYYALRSAEDADGTLSTGAVAPVVGDLAAPVAGAAATFAYSDGSIAADTHSAAPGGIPLPLDTTVFDEIAVRTGRFVNLYLAAASSVNCILVGPYE
jgi:hypothetical protein